MIEGDTAGTRRTARAAVGFRYFAAMAAGAALVLVAFGSFNFGVDPLQFYRKSTHYPPQFSFEQRFQNPGLARNYDYDTAILGTSVTENFYSGDVEARMGGKSMKLSISGSTAHEQALILDVAFRHGAPRTVIWGLDWFAFSTPHDAVRDDRAPFPHYLYGSRLHAIRGYLLNWDTFLLAVEAVRSSSPPRDLDSLNAWDRERPPDCEELVRLFHDPEVLRSNRNHMKRMVHGASAVRKTVNENFFRLVEEHSDTTFYAYFPPYSIAHHRYYESRFPQEYATLEILRTFVSERAAEFPNLRLFDFQTVREWTHDFAEYADMTHHSRKLNGSILEAFVSGAYRVDPRAGPADLRSQVARFRSPISKALCEGTATDSTMARSR